MDDRGNSRRRNDGRAPFLGGARQSVAVVDCRREEEQRCAFDRRSARIVDQIGDDRFVCRGPGRALTRPCGARQFLPRAGGERRRS